jgi:hypothetical protein
MKFNSQICTTREQSERLLALGLKKETADMVLVPSSKHDGSDVIRVRKSYLMEEDAIPAWSLHRLLCLYNCHYLEFMGEKEIASAYDIVIEAIESAITGGYFNEKYLE